MSRLRMVVTGQKGQVVRSLVERASASLRFEIVALGRPDLDLLRTDEIAPVIESARPDIIISAAAYTAVDQAESDQEAATRINGTAVGRIAHAAARMDVPIIHLSTDYVFDGSKSAPYTENDPTAPISAYGRSKLAGESALANATDNYAILRTAWVYSPFGRNFLRTMLKLAQIRETIGVVDDQIGNPTSALDIANSIFLIAENLLSSDDAGLRGIFHMTGRGQASWADFASEIISQSARLGGPTAIVERVSSNAYPTPAARPANSRLDCSRLFEIHGVQLPDWRQSTAEIIARLM
jgi:dTDP-4-dehydrorhamnose reductase